jgi:hypothetical protein
VEENKPTNDIETKGAEYSSNVPESPNNPASSRAQAETDARQEREIKSLQESIRAGEKWLIWLTAAMAFFALCGVVVGVLQWKAMKLQSGVMQGQLEQMKGSSVQADKLIGETHALATNAGTQANNAADQVKRLSDLVDATNKQAVATAGELAIMQKQLEAADRPWIKIDIASSDLSYDTSGVKVGLRYIFTNVGRSPAKNVWRSARLIAAILLMGVPKGNPEPKEVQRQVCNSLATRTPDISGYALFPGDHFTDQDVLALSMQELSVDNWARLNLPLPRPLPLGIVGCVDYTFESSPRHHQTGFAFLVSGSNGGSPVITEIPMHQSVGLALTPVSGFYFAN